MILEVKLGCFLAPVFSQCWNLATFWPGFLSTRLNEGNAGEHGRFDYGTLSSDKHNFHIMFSELLAKVAEQFPIPAFHSK